MPVKRDIKGRFVKQEFEISKISEAKLKKYRHAVAQRKYLAKKKAEKFQGEVKIVNDQFKKIRQAANLQNKIRKEKGQGIIKGRKLNMRLYGRGRNLFHKKYLLFKLWLLK